MILALVKAAVWATYAPLAFWFTFFKIAEGVPQLIVGIAAIALATCIYFALEALEARQLKRGH